MSTFDTTKQPLPHILEEITDGKIQLPDFQRGWVWDDNHVQSLLISIARSFPVGAVMMLETGGEVRFQTRPIENVEFPGAIPKPETLILDGQQRLTSLTQVLKLDRPVKTFTEKDKPIERYYYFDILRALESETLEDALIAVDADKKIKTNFGRDVVLDLSTTELECRQLHFPCNQILSADDWEMALQEYAPEHFGVYMQFRKKVINAFRGYQLPIIELTKETSKEAVCLVFEKVNTGGVPLSVFELVTATYAADGFNLRDDWFGSRLRKIEGRAERLKKEAVLGDLEATDFLQAITLLHTCDLRQQDLASGKTGKSVTPVSAKRAAILMLPLDEYRQRADVVEQGFRLAAKFLRKEAFFVRRDVPYRTQLPPLAAVMTHLGERWLEPRIYDKLSRWFWCGVLGELYGGAVETRVANDLEDLLKWFEDDEAIPRTVYDATFTPSRLYTLRSRLSAAYKGLSVLLLRERARDFFWKATIQELDAEEMALDIHHIFPRAWCQEHSIRRELYDCIVNKAPISYKANRMIGGNAPAEYLRKLQEHKQVKLDDAAMDRILRSHRIDPDALRRNDYDAFFRHRKEALLGMIERVTGKSVARDVEEPVEDEELAAA